MYIYMVHYMYKSVSLMNFEWDTKKDHINQDKHNVSFVEAQQAFLDDQRIIAIDHKHSTPDETMILPPPYIPYYINLCLRQDILVLFDLHLTTAFLLDPHNPKPYIRLSLCRRQNQTYDSPFRDKL